ncbi:MAG TPA: hypothetical protein DCM40_38690 [Maribacter sp.]|nr:hypothetical protein [Maribacter sp.]
MWGDVGLIHALYPHRIFARFENRGAKKLSQKILENRECRERGWREAVYTRKLAWVAGNKCFRIALMGRFWPNKA